MSAIDTTFTWVRNPTAINGLATTYVSKRGSDTTGNGTAQNPYASIAKATSVATNGTNIMLDDGRWDEARTLNNIAFKWWGNGRTIICSSLQLYHKLHDEIHYIIADKVGAITQTHDMSSYIIAENSIVSSVNVGGYSSAGIQAKNCIIFNTSFSSGSWYGTEMTLENCILINYIPYKAQIGINTINLSNNTAISNESSKNCNFTIGSISGSNSINDAITGQTIQDYFNKISQSFVTNITSITLQDILNSDFTAKEGSANIGAGEKGTTIGLNQGFTMYADNSADDMFSASNGATLKNIEWNSTLNGYTLIQMERVCAGATANTITLDSNASSIDDYYNNLFVGIVGGDGYGEIFKIIDYDGATKTATIDGSWNTTPHTSSVYTISGTILSAVKDFEKVIKVKRNWTFAENFTTLADGRWAEFLTNLTSQGKELPVNCFFYEYSIDGTNWIQGHTSDDLVSATDGENKVYDKIYGDCSANYDEASAKELVMRYIRINIHIGFNI